MLSRRLARLCVTVCALVLSLWASPTLAHQGGTAPPDAPRPFNIPAGPLAGALRRYAVQSGLELLFDSRIADGRTAGAISGLLTPQEALTHLLLGSGLVADQPRPGVLTLHAGAAPAPPTPTLDTYDPGGSAAAPASEIVVTGSLIRGHSDGASPLITLDRAELDRSGRATVADALSALPQAFTGMATPQTQLLQTDGVANNTAASTHETKLLFALALALTRLSENSRIRLAQVSALDVANACDRLLAELSRAATRT